MTGKKGKGHAHPGAAADAGKVRNVVLIQPPDPKGYVVLRDHMGKFGIVEKDTSIVREDVFPPLDLASAAAVLEKEGFCVSIIDAPTLGYDRSKVLRETFASTPDLIVVNTSGVTLAHDLDTAGWLQKTIDVPVVAHTPTITKGNPAEKTMIDSDISTFIRGELEYTLLELCQRYPAIDGIQGVVGKKGRKLLYNEERPLLRDLDALPIPAYHLLPMDRYSSQMFPGKKGKFTTILASRGCPFGCIYCIYPLGYGNFWRGRSAKNVLQEMRLLRDRFGIEAFLFRDQVVNFSYKRMKKICDGLIADRAKGKRVIEWRGEGRADMLDRDLIVRIKKSGCGSFQIGVESGDQDIMSSVAKSGLTLGKVREVVKDAKDIGLPIITGFMIGFPGETKESVKRTLDFAREISPDRAWFCAVTPYPGTKLYSIAKRKGWLLTKRLDDYTARQVVMKTDKLSAEDIKRAVDMANITFSKDTRQLLGTVLSTHGIVSAIKDPAKAIRYTIGRALVRNPDRIFERHESHKVTERGSGSNRDIGSKGNIGSKRNGHRQMQKDESPRERRKGD